MRRSYHPLVGALVLLFAVQTAGPPPATAASSDVVLADFEQPDLTGVSVDAPGADRVTTSTAFASTGRRALRFDLGGTGAKDGTVFPRVFLANGTALPAADWRAYRYLHVGMLSANPVATTLYLVVRDKAGKYLQRQLPAGAFTYRAFSVPTADVSAAGVDLGNLKEIQLSAPRTTEPQVIYADDVRLTDTPTDEAAEQARTAPRVVTAMGLAGLRSADAKLLSAVGRRIPHSNAREDQALRGQADTLDRRFDALAQQIPGLGGDVATARTILAELTTGKWRVQRLGGMVDARGARPHQPVGLGFADSMSLVYPRDLPCHCTWDGGSLGLARGEYENIQLVAVPYRDGLSGATVRATAHGKGLSVSVAPVGSLNMAPPVAPVSGTPTPWRPSVYSGWTPDPILTSRTAVDVAGSADNADFQAFWVGVRADSTAKPGHSKVDLELTARGVPPQRAGLDVTVWDVAIPDRAVLRTAVGTDPKAYAEPYGVTDPDGVAKLSEQKWNFLAQYKIQADNIYRSVYQDNPPSVDELRATEKREGGLRQFNIWYFDPRLFKLDQPDTWNAQADQLFDRIQPYVDQYRAAGLIDKAYLYCCDETRDEYFPMIKAVLTRFKARFPDIPVLTTAIDDTMGTRSGLDALVGRWVRDVPWYSKEVIDRRHAAGREAWWYLHAGVHNPYPNLLMGYDPGQLRTLLGPMSYQSKVDGFLYYRVDRWYNHPVLADGPLSAWDPRTWNNVAGDGSLFYPGPNGPMPSIRLQNFRDGMEDYNLLTALRSAVDHAPPGTDPGTLARARKLLSGADVVTDQRDYQRDPAKYRHWRQQVADTTVRLRR